MRHAAPRTAASRWTLTAALALGALILVGTGVFAATTMQVRATSGTSMQAGSAPATVTCSAPGNGDGQCKNGKADWIVTATVPLSR